MDTRENIGFYHGYEGFRAAFTPQFSLRLSWASARQGGDASQFNDERVHFSTT